MLFSRRQQQRLTIDPVKTEILFAVQTYFPDDHHIHLAFRQRLMLNIDSFHSLFGIATAFNRYFTVNIIQNHNI